MTVFAAYARYYDLLYRDKDYSAEADYVSQLLATHAPAARRILELGCGTGGHARALASRGYEVYGVDSSEGMLQAASEKCQELPREHVDRLHFVHGDARELRLNDRFDAVASLFHVMSYQTSDADIGAAFRTVREHLNDGGTFIFDCWYGPAVLAQRPRVTRRELSDPETAVIRVARPVMHPEENVVDVNYTLQVSDRVTGETEEILETHRMRYFFTPEVERLLGEARMRLAGSFAWLSDRAPDADSWGACYVARA